MSMYRRLQLLSAGLLLGLAPWCFLSPLLHRAAPPAQPFSGPLLRQRGELRRAALAQEPGASEGVKYEIVVAKDVMLRMRDGVRLATDIYRPALNGAAAPGRFPAILERTPYNKETVEAWAHYFVPRGYVAVGQDVRGRYGSEGRWRPHYYDVHDGYDTAKWIGDQAWSDGSIGTVGTSYPGGTQHALALSNPPYLKAMIPVDAMSDYGRYGVRHNGAFELRWLNWIFTLGLPNGSQYARDPAVRAALTSMGQQVRDYIRGLPLRGGTTPLRLAPDYEAFLIESMSHGDYDDFWKDCGADVVSHVAECKDVPVYLVGGWYDSWGAQTANLNYVALSKTKKGPIRLIMGPWTHGAQTQSFAGEAEFGPEAALDLLAFRGRWFGRWLKGLKNGVEREPPVRIFIMGAATLIRRLKAASGLVATGAMRLSGRWRERRTLLTTCTRTARCCPRSRTAHPRLWRPPITCSIPVIRCPPWAAIFPQKAA
jgi:putative CocE/NonD family hydrolase